MRALCFLALVLGLATSMARAEVVELDSCTDASGQVVQGTSDSSLKVLVRSGVEGGHSFIRYNPDLLPNLSVMARQFFFAQECARLSLGKTPGAELTPSQARHADCVGVGILRAAETLQGASAVQDLEAELVFSDDEWAQLPGPRRPFNLMACPKQTSIALASETPRTADQDKINACIRQCGDRLYRCDKSCRGAADCGGGCLGSYDRCEADCKTR